MTYELEAQIHRDISIEIFRAAKIPEINWLRKILSPLFRTPVNRFAALIADFDDSVGADGFVIAARKILAKLTNQVIAEGQKHIPPAGPLIIASNHPGTYDGLAIISSLPRDDFRLIVSDVPFFKNLPNAGRNLIFASHDVSERMEVIRKSIAHLKQGGSLLIYPSGRLDPDPSIYSNADEGFLKWSRSIEIFVNKVPQARLVLAVASGVISREFISHPVLKFFRDDHEHRRMMEFMQVIKQMVLGKPVALYPKVTFSEVITLPKSDIKLDAASRTLILSTARQLLGEHINRFYPKIE